MKKLLEVLQYGENDIRFNTDIDVMKNPNQVLEITSMSAMAMMTTLWGGNERSVIAVIRALAIADLAVSVDPDEMLERLGDSAAMLKKSMDQARAEMEKKGVKVDIFGPGVSPSKEKS